MPSCVEVSGFVWMAGIAGSFRVSSGKGLFLADGVFSERRNVDTPEQLSRISPPTSSPHIFQSSTHRGLLRGLYLYLAAANSERTNDEHPPAIDHPPWATDT